MAEDERIYRHLWSMVPNMGTQTMKRLVEQSGSLAHAWEEASLTDLGHWLSETKGKKMYPYLQRMRDKTDPETERKRLEGMGIHLIVPEDEEYPSLLHEIHAPPRILYVRGSLEALTDAVAVVGTRKASRYGRNMTRRLSSDLAASGYAIISGLALGIDGAAHEGALEVEGTTVAVLGGGVDEATITPRRHVSLANRIIRSGGAVMSEYPPGTTPRAATFPQRNRIVSGMSRGVLVTEASARSGALITARCATQENRDVFALPGPVDQNGFRGCNQLIKEGAKLVETVDDITDELGGISFQTPEGQERSDRALPEMTETETAIYTALETEPLPHDLIAERTNIDIAKVISSLSMLELKGVVQADGAVYRLN